MWNSAEVESFLIETRKKSKATAALEKDSAKFYRYVFNVLMHFLNRSLNAKWLYNLFKVNLTVKLF